MKTKLPLYLFLLFFPSADVDAQSVVIEGGPDTVQISDRDGKPEPINPQRVTGPNAVTRDEMPVPNVVVPPGTSAANRPLAPRPAPGQVTGPVGVAVPPPPSPPRTLAAGEAKRLAELKRELGIMDTGTSAALTLDTQNVFVDGAATVDAIAVEKLTLIAEYLQLALAKEIHLTYHFAPNLHDEDLAWARSVAMVKWMSEKGGLVESTFTITNPEKVTEAIPTPVPADGDLTAMRNHLEFNVTFR